MKDSTGSLRAHSPQRAATLRVVDLGQDASRLRKLALGNESADLARKLRNIMAKVENLEGTGSGGLRTPVSDGRRSEGSLR